MARYFVVVDGYSSGNMLAPAFAARGVQALHVSSTPEHWPLLATTYKPQDFAAEFFFTGDMQALVDWAGGYRPVCVVAGTETGVPLADALSEALGLPTNGTKHAAARRNKYLMIEAARAAGLKVAKQHKADNAEAIVRWVADQGLAKVVVKPLESAGTDSVAICTTPEQVREACARILGTTNQLGLFNREVLCQEFLSGTEYALDAVSLNGQAHFTAVWRYHKLAINGGDFVYDRDELVECTDEAGTALCAYVRQVLDALGVVHGPSHAEVMLTAQGPALVEIGTRMNGVTTPQLNDRCVGVSQLALTADSYLDHQAFRARAGEPYKLAAYASSVSLISHQEGVVKNVPGDALVRGLASFDEVRWRAKPGYELHKTVDYFTLPGFVMLVHEDREQVERDLRQLRRWEVDGALYELA